jgi:carotenoid cleavage dioxygenase-like enzyme
VREKKTNGINSGVIVSPVMSNCEKEFPFLLFFDGNSFQEIARATFPATIPFGFHSIFLSDKKKCVRADV